jgi:hypothetical protein
VRYIPIGEDSPNLALQALALRPAGDHAELFARVTNYSDSERPAILSIYAGGELVHAQTLSITAKGDQAVVLEDLPFNPAGGAGGGEESVYEARLSPVDPTAGPLDVFSLDDAAYAVYQPAGTGRTLLATGDPSGNIFLEQVLAALPGVVPFRVLPDEDGQVRFPEPGAEPFDLYVLDGFIPDKLPSGNLLLVNPPSNPLFECRRCIHGYRPGPGGRPSPDPVRGLGEVRAPGPPD